MIVSDVEIFPEAPYKGKFTHPGALWFPLMSFYCQYKQIETTCVGSKITQTVSVVLLPFLKES